MDKNLLRSSVYCVKWLRPWIVKKKNSLFIGRNVDAIASVCSSQNHGAVDAVVVDHGLKR